MRWKHRRLLSSKLFGPTPEIERDTAMFEFGQKMIKYFQKELQNNKSFDAAPFICSTVFSVFGKLFLSVTFEPNDPILDYFAEMTKVC